MYHMYCALMFTAPYTTCMFLNTSIFISGYCDQCSPENYYETTETFPQRCLDGNPGLNDTYSEDLVERAIHLIRNPLDNIVSRFHNSYNNFVKIPVGNVILGNLRRYFSLFSYHNVCTICLCSTFAACSKVHHITHHGIIKTV